MPGDDRCALPYCCQLSCRSNRPRGAAPLGAILACVASECPPEAKPVRVCRVRPFISLLGKVVGGFLQGWWVCRTVVGTMEDQLNCSHMAPTAPDTLECHPYAEKDPFLITESPHVYFSGCEKGGTGFESKLVETDDSYR